MTQTKTDYFDALLQDCRAQVTETHEALARADRALDRIRAEFAAPPVHRHYCRCGDFRICTRDNDRCEESRLRSTPSWVCTHCDLDDRVQDADAQDVPDAPFDPKAHGIGVPSIFTMSADDLRVLNRTRGPAVTEFEPVAPPKVGDRGFIRSLDEGVRTVQLVQDDWVFLTGGLTCTVDQFVVTRRAR